MPFGYVKLMIHEECDEMAGIEQMDNIEDTFLRADTPAIDVKVFNPPKSNNNFMNQYAEECEHKEGTRVFHSYYYNVPVKWLGQRFFDRAEWFKVNKPLYYENNYLGKVTGSGGAIFENLEVREITDSEIDNMTYFYYGLDWGFTHPQAFTKVAYNEDTDTVYILWEHVAVGQKQQTFARKIKEFKECEIIADSEAPDKIRDYLDWGFNVVGAVKRWKGGGRDYAWEWLQTVRKIVIDPNRTPKALHEFNNAEHEQLKDGSFSSEYPRLEEDSIMSIIYALNRVIIGSKKENFDYDYEEEDYYEEDE
jgi:phage terminase large subunit